MQAGELVARPLGKHFHAAVVIVAHPAGNAEDVGLTLDEPAEADALDTPADQEAAGVDRLFANSHLLKNCHPERRISLAKARLTRSRRIPITSLLPLHFRESQRRHRSGRLAAPPRA